MEKENKKIDEHKITKIIAGIYLPLSLLIYFILGSMIPNNHGWSIGWIVFLGIVIFPSLSEAIIKKDMNLFAYPILVAAIYVAIGLIGLANNINLWHPYWVMFLTIPIYYLIGYFLKKKNNKNEK